MYRYDEVDFRLVNERVAQFRDQTRRYLASELTEDEFRPLRLMNGLYVQRHAPMLRVAVPYGMLSSRQLRKLAHIARTYDRGYAHFTTRQNLQFNWPALETVPDILAELAEVEMHAIQTSGNCIRNVTTDQFAGVAADEVIAADEMVDSRCAELDQKVFSLQLLEAPVAGDQRLLHVGLIAVIALERVGDLAKNIAKRVGAVGQTATPRNLSHSIDSMSELVLSQVNNVISRISCRSDPNKLCVRSALRDTQRCKF